MAMTQKLHILLFGASLSESHTRELGEEFSVCMFVCMFVSVGLRARIRGKMFAWSCQNNC